MESKRSYAGFIDFLTTCFIQASIGIAFILPQLANEQLSPGQAVGRVFLMTFVSVTYMVIRDVLGSKSLGKRIMKVHIIDHSSEAEANGWQRLVRNLTWYLGVVEVIVLLATGRRIGDYIAGTTVVAD